MSTTPIALTPPSSEHYGVSYCDWAREHEQALEHPYPSALYTNLRSGIQWQAYDERAGVWFMRRERRLHGGQGWFRFTRTSAAVLKDPRRWRYDGPTGLDHYLRGYDLPDVTTYVTAGYRIKSLQEVREDDWAAATGLK